MKTKFLLMLTLATLLSALLCYAPAQATVIPGSATAVINNVAGNPDYSYHSNAVGYARGSLTTSYEFYVGPSSTGPWQLIYSDSHSCSNSTSCSTVTQYGTCTDAWYKMVAHAVGPGGRAENDPAIKIKHIYGSLPAISTGSALTVSNQCKIHTEKI